MKTAGEWALQSPEGTFHKLSEPNFFVGREDQMDLTLKVGDKLYLRIFINPLGLAPNFEEEKS